MEFSWGILRNSGNAFEAPPPVFKASKFREIAALAKRTTGNCFGLIDSVARYRKKLWKSIEGHHQFFEAETT